MKKYLAIAGLVALLSACGGKNNNAEKSKNVDFEKPLYRISQTGDTLVKYIYDQNFNLIEYFDLTSDYSFSYVYNDKNQLIEENDVEGGKTQYEYDDKGNLKKVIKPEYCEFLEYNNQNLLISDSIVYSNNNDAKDSEVQCEGDGNQIDYSVEKYRYIDNKQIKEYKNYDSESESEETLFDVRYCIDSEFKYDTLELIGCNKDLEWYEGKVNRQWKLINGNYLNTLVTCYYLADGDYTFESSIEYEYNEQGVETKYVYCKQENTPQSTYTYTVEGNKVTDNKGNITYYLEK